jgi:two-component system sensor histidine kinase YesM
MENVASGIEFTCQGEVDNAAKLAHAIYTSRYVNDFIHREFDSHLEYYGAYRDFFDDTLVNLVDGQDNIQYYFYLNNDTIINGSQFQQLKKAENTEWYKYIKESGLKKGLVFDFGGKMPGVREDERKIYYFMILDFYTHDCDDILLVEINFGNLNRILQNLNYDFEAYVCDDTRVLISNTKNTGATKPYTPVSDLKGVGCISNFQLYNEDLTVRVVEAKNRAVVWRANWGKNILMIIFANIVFPAFLITILNKFTYNYRIREQEMIVASKNAELLALHSQINPHFLFNALESIRMHSIIKKETETAEMVEKLAKLQRQYTEWNEDNVPISQELEFAENYLGLQKYRFGERLSYSIEVEDDCRNYLIPKLTLVTFVENACVHGIESKNSNGWIFLRISKNEEELTVEIEDTGSGMSEEETEKLLGSMRNADIDMLKKKGRVGIINACLRLKMVTENAVSFDLESEEGIGTLVTIKAPLKSLRGVKRC